MLFVQLQSRSHDVTNSHRLFIRGEAAAADELEHTDTTRECEIQLGESPVEAHVTLIVRLKSLATADSQHIKYISTFSCYDLRPLLSSQRRYYFCIGLLTLAEIS